MSTTRTSSSTQINQFIPGEESRKVERFSLRLPACISAFEPGHPTLNLMTENISDGGAFFPTREPLPQGLRVLVDLTLKRESGVGNASKVHLKGRVLRSQPDGMALLFEKRVQMLRLETS